MIRLSLFFLILSCGVFANVSALYLTWTADPTTTMSIHWHTPKYIDRDTLYLKAPGGSWQAVIGEHEAINYLNVHTVHLAHLHPDTEYSFRVGEYKPIYKFKTAPRTLEEPLRFVVGGDADHSTQLFQKMNETIVKKDPLFCVIGGDIAYAVNHSYFGFHVGAFNQWISFLSIWSKQMITEDHRIIPLIIGIGNHDISKDTADLVFKLFPSPEKRFYRALDFGHYMSLILLDTDHYDPIEGEQTQWLTNTLANKVGTPFRFAIYHEAAYPSVYPFDGEIPKQIRRNWCPLFDEYKISAAFENHNHAFKRTFPLTAGAIHADGIIYFGDGCWGAKPRQTSDMWYLEKRASTDNVYLIELSDLSANVKAIDIKGSIIDSKQIKPFEDFEKKVDFHNFKNDETK